MITLLENTQIDFTDGSVKIRGVEAFVIVYKPDTGYSIGGEELTGVYRMVYMAPENGWRSGTTELIGNAVRTFLQTLSIDGALVTAKAGYDLISTNPEQGMPNNEADRLKRILEEWGVTLKTVTIQDIILPKAIVDARQQSHTESKLSDAAEHKEKRVRRETVGQEELIFKGLLSIGWTEEDARREAADRWRYWRGTETERLVHFYGEKGDLASIAAMVIGGAEAVRQAFPSEQKTPIPQESEDSDAEKTGTSSSKGHPVFREKRPMEKLHRQKKRGGR